MHFSRAGWSMASGSTNKGPRPRQSPLCSSVQRWRDVPPVDCASQTLAADWPSHLLFCCFARAVLRPVAAPSIIISSLHLDQQETYPVAFRTKHRRHQGQNTADRAWSAVMKQSARIRSSRASKGPAEQRTSFLACLCHEHRPVF